MLGTRRSNDLKPRVTTGSKEAALEFLPADVAAVCAVGNGNEPDTKTCRKFLITSELGAVVISEGAWAFFKRATTNAGLRKISPF